MKKKDRWWNSALIVLTIAGIGFGLVCVVFREYLGALAGNADLIRAWLSVIVASAYAAGFFITRVVEDAFDAVFDRPPFSETGADVGKDREKHPLWIDSLLWPVAYFLFFIRVLIPIGLLIVVVKLVVWVTVGLAPTAS